MIPENIVTAWSIKHPWPDSDQVEQDLLLAQAICEIANDELRLQSLSDEASARLVFGRNGRYV